MTTPSLPLPRFLRLALISAGLLAAGRASEPAPPFVTTVSASGGAFVAADAGGVILATERDPSAAINAAIARVSQLGGGTVLIAAGTYDLAVPVELRTGVRLIGEGGLLSDDTPRSAYPTILRAAAAMPAIVEAINADGARLEHLVLDGSGAVANVVRTASYAFRMRDCVVRGETQRCVWVTAGKPLGHDMYVQPTFINCLFDQGGRGVGVEGARDSAKLRTGQPAEPHKGDFTDGVITRCRFAHVGEMGAAICGGWQFFANQVEGPARQGGVAVFGGATTVTDNDIETEAGPAVAVRLGNVAITGNRLIRRGDGDIVAVDAGLQAITITRNRWSGRGGYFVDFQGPEIVRDCAVFGNSGQGQPVTNLAASSRGLYCADNPAADIASWRPRALAARPAPPPIGAVVSLSGPLTVARDLAGAEIASDRDAAKAINAAVLAVSRRGPGAVFVTRGTYLCGGPIVLRPGVVLAGEGGMSRVPVGFEAMGTVLKAGPPDVRAVLDLTDAPGAGVDELAVDGSLVAESCVRLAARSACLDNAFVERARSKAIEVTNGNDPAPDAYSGMWVADVLVHAGAEATGLAVHADPAARGAPPSAGTATDVRLRLGIIQADFADGAGWTVVGNHGTSNGHSTVGFKLDAPSMYVAGNYFDTVHGPRVRIAGSDLTLIGNHFQATPTAEIPTLVVEAGARGVSIEASTWHPPPGQRSRDSYFAVLAGPPNEGLRIIGNVGEGVGQIVPPRLPSGVVAGNFVAPPTVAARADAGK